MIRRISENDVLSFTDHLEELRFRLIISVIALVVGTTIAYFLAPSALEILIKPLERANQQIKAQPVTVIVRVDEQGRMRLADGLDSLLQAEKNGSKYGYRLEFRREGAGPEEAPLAVLGERSRASMIYLRPTDPFFLILKISLILGVILALPVILWQLWLFVAPGLTGRERKWAAPVIISGSLLFPAGCAFAYFLLAYALRFFASYTVPGLIQQLDIRAYLGFALTTMLSFGTVFELPIAVLLAAQVGLVSVSFLRKRRKEVFVLLLILSAFLTPTVDPFTLMAMTLPLYGLFEASIWIARLMEQHREEEEPSPDEDDTPAEGSSHTE